MAKISIVMPIYNMEQYLSEALDSIINQSFNDFEILCIDDCSNDNSLNILEQYSNSDSRIKVIKLSQNKGTGYARNVGLDNAIGEYILFLDPDDWYDEDCLATLYEKINSADCDIVFFNSRECNFISGKTRAHAKLSAFKKYLDGQVFFLKDVKNDFIKGKIACWNRIYRRSFLEEYKIRFSNTVSGEDIPFSILSYLCAGKVSVCNKEFYNFRKYCKGIARRCIDQWYDIFINFEISYDMVHNHCDNKFILKHFLNYYINQIMGRYYYVTNIEKNLKPVIYERVRSLLKRAMWDYKFYNLCLDINKLQFIRYILCPNYKLFEFFDVTLPSIFSAKRGK